MTRGWIRRNAILIYSRRAMLTKKKNTTAEKEREKTKANDVNCEMSRTHKARICLRDSKLNKTHSHFCVLLLQLLSFFGSVAERH